MCALIDRRLFHLPGERRNGRHCRTCGCNCGRRRGWGHFVRLHLRESDGLHRWLALHCLCAYHGHWILLSMK